MYETLCTVNNINIVLVTRNKYCKKCYIVPYAPYELAIK